MNDKHPIGLRPRSIYELDEHRLRRERGLEILGAMLRYIENDKPLPEEWVNELRDLFQGV